MQYGLNTADCLRSSQKSEEVSPRLEKNKKNADQTGSIVDSIASPLGGAARLCMDEKDGEELLDYLAVTYSCLTILLSRGEASMYCEQRGTGVQSRMFGVLAWFPGRYSLAGPSQKRNT